jgi:hypothetical protein
VGGILWQEADGGGKGVPEQLADERDLTPDEKGET